ncbi:MAG: response regulator transcription factor [Candidatus Latescibacteria bacterium]|nr:response regulator transcription factor [Candidatus Latescibacterota bacterium]
MKILISDDDAHIRELLKTILEAAGHEVVEAGDGREAWNLLMPNHGPKLAVIDWVMPEMNGPEVCRKIRELGTKNHIYMILITVKHSTGDIVEGLEAGANDYLTKPFSSEEILARVDVGIEMLNLHSRLAERVQQLEAAMAEVSQLKKLLPICSYCKKVRKDDDYWQELDEYVEEHLNPGLSYGICADCYDAEVAPQLEKWKSIDFKPKD